MPRTLDFSEYSPVRAPAKDTFDKRGLTWLTVWVSPAKRLPLTELECNRPEYTRFG